jgi:hypothetical protein
LKEERRWELQVRLDGKTNEELVAMQSAIESDPRNQMPPGHLFLYTPQARKKLDEIARAITSNLREKRRLAGDPVDDSGYSGRQSNRRR